MVLQRVCRQTRADLMARLTLSRAFGLVLREHRRKAGLTQEAFAFRAKVHPTYVGLIERGKRKPALDSAQRLATGLGLALSSLIAEAEKRC